MSDLDFIRLGEPGCVEQSAGYKEWLQKRGRRANRPGDLIDRQPQPTRGLVGSRFSMLRRDLEVREMEAGAALPLAASRMVSLHPDARGHFYAQAGFDGRNVRMMIDTGATFCSLTEEDAERVGIRLRANEFTRELSTQNGPIKVAPVCIDNIQVGSINMHSVEAVISKRGPGCESLLGMSFLNRLSRWSMEGRRLVLRS